MKYPLVEIFGSILAANEWLADQSSKQREERTKRKTHPKKVNKTKQTKMARCSLLLFFKYFFPILSGCSFL